MSGFRSFSEFYPYYLSEHKDPVCRRLHYIGSTLVLAILVTLAVTGLWGYWWLMLVAGYGFAWVGHFFFEKNKPATFKYPGYSLASDFLLFWDLLSGNQPFKVK